VPELLYGIEATGQSTAEFKSTCFAYDEIFAKLFNSRNPQIIATCASFILVAYQLNIDLPLFHNFLK